MELEEVLLKRRSVRKFTKEPVTDEMIDKLLHAAMSGPSAVNKTSLGVLCRPRSEAKLAALNKVGFASYPSPFMIVIAGNQKQFLPAGPRAIIGSKMSPPRPKTSCLRQRIWV
jgi:nitroreductase